MSRGTLGAARLVMLAMVVGVTNGAGAETQNCTPITSLPAVVTVQGVYCLTGDLTTGMTSGHAIDIQTNNVVLDLNGFKLGGLAAGLGTTTRGIHAADRQNITIRNGTVRGFLYGIALTTTGASQGHVVERMRADQNTYVGMAVDGAGNVVRHNQVVQIGGSTTFGTNASAVGIVVLGHGAGSLAPNQVLDNSVSAIVKQGSGTSWGIFFASETTSMAVNNQITGAARGIDYSGGSAGKYRDNLTFDVALPYSGGTDAGNNN